MQKYSTHKEILAYSSTDSEAVFLVLKRTEISAIRLKQQLYS